MARNVIVINVDLRETRVALVEAGVIAELHIERQAQRGTVGNVVLGKVTRVLPGMQAAFIDVGQERAAFLHVEDLIRPDDFDAFLSSDSEDEAPDEDSVETSYQRASSSDEVARTTPSHKDNPGNKEKEREGGRGRRGRGRGGRGRNRAESSGRNRRESVHPRHPVEGESQGTFENGSLEDEAGEGRVVDVSTSDADLDPVATTLGTIEQDFDEDAEDERDSDEFLTDDEGSDSEAVDVVELGDNDDETDEVLDEQADDDDALDDEETDDELSTLDDEEPVDEDDLATDDEGTYDETLDNDESEDSEDDESEDIEEEDSEDDESEDSEDDESEEDDSEDDEEDELPFDDERDEGDSGEDELPLENGDDDEPVDEPDDPAGDVDETDEDSSEVKQASTGEFPDAPNPDRHPQPRAENSRGARSVSSRRESSEDDSKGDRFRRRRRRRRRGGSNHNGAGEEEAEVVGTTARHAGRKGRRRSRRGANNEQEKTPTSNGKENGTSRRVPARVSRSVPISEVVKEGDQVVVQISKEPIGTKGARVTSHVSLPGRYVVYLPTVEHVGISKRIGNARERGRLRSVIESLKPPTGGLIVRTVAEGLTKKQLKADVGYLIKVWAEIASRRESAKAPQVLYEELDLVLKVARDFFTDEIDLLIIDDREQYGRLVRFVEMFMPARVKDIKLYTGDEPVFDAYGIEDEIRRALSRKVPLPSGGSLIMDQAEALTAIDVNTGRYVGKGSKDLEETALKTNLEAVDEIAYQLRFRNIGGLVILDLIDMEKASNREKVWRALEQKLAKDKAKTTINRISELGLIEMTRKRTRESLGRTMHEACFYCDGTGQIQSRETIAYEILRQIRRDRMTLPGYSVRVHAHPAVVDFLKFEAKDALHEAERRYMRRIDLQPRQEYHIEQYDLQGR